MSAKATGTAPTTATATSTGRSAWRISSASAPKDCGAYRVSAGSSCPLGWSLRSTDSRSPRDRHVACASPWARFGRSAVEGGNRVERNSSMLETVVGRALGRRERLSALDAPVSTPFPRSGSVETVADDVSRTFPCSGHSGLKQLSFFTSRGPCRRKNCVFRNRAQTLPPTRDRRRPPTLDCRITHPSTGGGGRRRRDPPGFSLTPGGILPRDGRCLGNRGLFTKGINRMVRAN